MLDDLKAAYLPAAFGYSKDRLHHVVDMTLGVDPTRDREAHEFHGGRDFPTGLRIQLSEHHGANFHATNARLEVELTGQGLAGEFMGGNVWQKGAGIQVNGMAAGRLKNGGSQSIDFFTQI